MDALLADGSPALIWLLYTEPYALTPNCPSDMHSKPRWILSTLQRMKNTKTQNPRNWNRKKIIKEWHNLAPVHLILYLPRMRRTQFLATNTESPRPEIGTLIGYANYIDPTQLTTKVIWGKITAIADEKKYTIELTPQRRIVKCTRTQAQIWALTDPKEIRLYQTQPPAPTQSETWNLEFNHIEWAGMKTILDELDPTTNLIPDPTGINWNPQQIKHFITDMKSLPAFQALTQQGIKRPPQLSTDFIKDAELIIEWANHEQRNRDKISWNSWLTEQDLTRNDINDLSTQLQSQKIDCSKRTHT